MITCERRILPAPTDQYDALLDWMGSTLDPGASLLEIGAGSGDAVYQARVAPIVGTWFGVDPDPAVAGNPYLSGHAVATTEAWSGPAPGPGSSPRFDAALAVYVVEHVDDPVAFFARIHAALRPGGSLFFLTPNLWHYFGLATLASHRVGIDEWLLRRLRGDELVEEYHFPVRYRCNAVPQIRRAAEAAGFTRMEVRHLDHPGVFQGYFPPALRRLPELWSAAAHRGRFGRLMGTLLVRLEA